MKMFILGMFLMLAGDAYAGWADKTKALEKEMKDEFTEATMTPERRQALNALVECAAPKFIKLMDKFSCKDDGKTVTSSLDACLESQDDARLDDSVGLATVTCMQEAAAKYLR